MTSQLSREQFIRSLSASGLYSQEELDAAAPTFQGRDGDAVAAHLIAAGKLTAFQATALRENRFHDLVIGNYQVLDRLGAGGMGTVFKARHRRMKRVVAVKVLSRSVSQNATFVQRFQREVEAVAQLSHPNIVMAYDADEAEAGHFLVMELVNGRDLASEVQERGPLPITEAVACIVQAARALDYAHGQGIIHRDIKPANLLRDVSGVVKVADLGLARFNDARRSEEKGGLTQAGTIMGTVDFMPPEQAMGATDIDHRADIYSLGCTLYFLLTGQPPYRGATLMATLVKHREAPIPSLGAVRQGTPTALDEIFQRMVAKSPQQRFASMAEVVRALEALPPVAEPQAAPQAATVSPTSATVAFAAASPPGGETVMHPRPGAGPSPPESTQKAVLLVEPSRSQAVIIRGYLQKLGFQEIHTAASGQEALDFGRKTPPQVVISAMHLADMTGVQLAEAMKADAALAGARSASKGESALPAIGVVLIASRADGPEDAVGVARNMVRLPKPFDLKQLEAAIATVASKPKQGENKLRVLVADDSSAARVHVCGVLAALGVEQVVEAADGVEAAIALGQETFDLLVTDYNMPRLDGRGLIDFVRHRHDTASLPIIVVTTETDPAKLEAVRQLGVSAICDKRFDREAVRVILERLGG